MRRSLLVMLAIVLAGCRGGADDAGEPGAVGGHPLGSEVPPGAEPDRFLVAVGDIACAPGDPVTATTCHQARTAALLARGRPLADPVGVLLLGDVQYEAGTPDEYRSFDGTWGRVLDRTDAEILPVAGNHEYGTVGTVPPGCELVAGAHHACGFAGYFSARYDVLDDGDAQYAVTFDRAASHPVVVVVVDVGACDLLPDRCAHDGPVVGFLRDALADPVRNPPAACTIVAFHQARWSELGHGDLEHLDPVWRSLFGSAARQRPDLVLNGHDHLYERYPRLDADGRPHPQGIPELVIGTGGREIAGGVPWLVPRFERLAAIDLSHFGVLRVAWDGERPTLTTSFVTEHGEIRDRVEHACRA
ncbi:MAG TPA: metallophosphoesterase [Actinomycetota bacterium]